MLFLSIAMPATSRGMPHNAGLVSYPALLPLPSRRFRFTITQQIGMDDSKHGGQTYPEMVKGQTYPEMPKGGSAVAGTEAS